MRFIRHYLKYIIVLSAFIITIVFFDSNGYLVRRRHWQEIDSLQQAILYYQNMRDNAVRQLNTLESDTLAIERVAREKYFMQEADEDIFIIQQP